MPTTHLGQGIEPKFFRGDRIRLQCSIRDEATGAIVPVGAITGVSMRVRSAAGGAVLHAKILGDGDLSLVDAATSTYQASLSSLETKALAAGKYFVHWQAVDQVNGEFTAATAVLPIQEGAFGA